MRVSSQIGIELRQDLFLREMQSIRIIVQILVVWVSFPNRCIEVSQNIKHVPAWYVVQCRIQRTVKAILFLGCCRIGRAVDRNHMDDGTNSWNTDGENITIQTLAATVHNGLLEVFA